MITYYLFGYFCGYFRTENYTETLEEFNEYLKKENLVRVGSKILNSENKQIGNIIEDTTGGDYDPDPYVDGHIKIVEN